MVAGSCRQTLMEIKEHLDNREHRPAMIKAKTLLLNPTSLRARRRARFARTVRSEAADQLPVAARRGPRGSNSLRTLVGELSS